MHNVLAMKNTFVTTQNKPITEYKIGAVPVETKKEFKVKSIHGIKLALIPKENIGIDPNYQRQYNKKQINNISDKWDYDLYEPVCVYMHRNEKTGLTYYQATDGQHRLCAHPDKKVLCRIVNTLAAVTRCIQANDTRTKKAWSVDDRFWAKNTELDRVKCKDKTLIKFTIKTFKSKGWSPLHPQREAAKDVGGKIASIHDYFSKYIEKNISPRIELSEHIRTKLAKEAIEDTADIMHELYDVNYISYGGRIWCSIFDWLTNPKHLNCQYDYETVLNALYVGEFRFKHDKSNRKATTMVNLRHQANMAIAKRVVNDRQHEGLVYVYNRILHTHLTTELCEIGDPHSGDGGADTEIKAEKAALKLC